MENNQRNSRKRLNSLILLVAFTAIMLIVSTYAWFSSQKNVTLDGLYGEVNVAEGLRMSLDAKHWVNSINFADFTQTTGAWTDDKGLYIDSGKTFQSPAEGVTNITPTEYLPVSTDGKATTDTAGNKRLVFYAGTNENTTQLKDIEEMAEEVDSGYFAFDIFLLNTTNGTNADELLLDAFSTVAVDNANTGLENTVRVAFALYENDTDGGASTDDGELSQDVVIANTSTGKAIESVSIWEPNSNAHVQSVLDNINPSITFSSTDKTDYSLASATSFALTEAIPTYALSSASVGKTYSNIYNWGDSIEAGLSKQSTLQTNTDFASGGTSVNITTVGGANLAIGANEYHKVRVYVWIEGQDPDCINVASFGGGITLDLGFSKTGTEN